jgi:flavin-dependent dehydrogenase
VLVGDAAGVADPFFGEGIAYAIQTGRFAADAVARFCAGDWSDLAGYTTAVQTVLGRDLRFWSILSRIIYRAPGLSVRLLASNRFFQTLADQAISGDKSFSKTWRH